MQKNLCDWLCASSFRCSVTYWLLNGVTAFALCNFSRSRQRHIRDIALFSYGYTLTTLPTELTWGWKLCISDKIYFRAYADVIGSEEKLSVPAREVLSSEAAKETRMASACGKARMSSPNHEQCIMRSTPPAGSASDAEFTSKSSTRPMTFMSSNTDSSDRPPLWTTSSRVASFTN